MIGIYKITSPTGRIYIGQSINIERRFNEYRNAKCKSQPKLFNSLLKYGHINHKFEVLIECDESELNELERYYQELYNVLVFGLNCTMVSSNSRSGKHSDETKSKISKALTNKPKSKESIDKIRIAKRGRFSGENSSFFGRKHTEISKQKISIFNKGNKYCLGREMSESTRKKIGDANRGEKSGHWGVKKSEETRLKTSISLKGKNTWMKGVLKTDAQKLKMSENNANSKKVIDINENKIYRSLKFYCEEKQLNYRTVQSNIRGLLKTNKYSFVKFLCDET